jgi:hypothetical protein
MSKQESPFYVMVSDDTMRSIRDRLVRRAEIDPDTLSLNLNVFISRLDTVFQDVPEELAGFKLDEIEVSLEISANGQVALWGIGGQVGGKGGIGLTFKRKSS